MEKWGIIQLSSSSLKFYTLCLTPIVIMAPEYLASKNTWVKSYPALRLPYWIQCRLSYTLYTGFGSLASWSCVLLTHFLSEFIDSDRIHIFDPYCIHMALNPTGEILSSHWSYYIDKQISLSSQSWKWRNCSFSKMHVGYEEGSVG